MPVRTPREGKKAVIGDGKMSQKVRTTNDLELLSMILAEDLPLRERVLRLLEQQLGKRELIKVSSHDRDG